MSHWRSLGVLLLTVWVLPGGLAGGGACAGEPGGARAATGTGASFAHDVMAVLSKAGCNMGACHGNQNGKGGLKLSLRGEDPAWDFDVLTREQAGRRTNAVEPDQSLILLKPTMQMAHEGGRRFARNSPEYAILRSWVAAGMPAELGEPRRFTALTVSPLECLLVAPADRVALRVEATFSDGSRRDVSRLAVYEPAEQIVSIDPGGMATRRSLGETTVVVRYLDRQASVRLAFVPNRPGFAWSGPPPANVIDEQVFAKLQKLQVNPSPPVNDGVFARRAYLDLLGVIPTADEARRFVADPNPAKRARLIDALLERQEFADFWALKWSDLLRNEEKTLDSKGVQNFHAWIRAGIAAGKPLDQFVRELIAARGSTYSEPAANYYRAMRDPLMRAESTAQLFLGVRLQCTKCHNHPFDRWTQNDYYSWANLFARVDYKILENRRRDTNDTHEFDGEQVVYMARQGEVKHPRTGATLPPRFLSDAAQPLRDDQDRLEELSRWVASPDNPRFVQTQANRIWYNLMGRGVVDPIDDFRATNPPVNPGLLDALAREFVAARFDLRQMIRLVMNSQVYQLSSAPQATNRDDELNFSHASVRRLSAEQLLDSLSQATGVPLEFNGYPAGTRAGELPGVFAQRRRGTPSSPADEFLQLFGKPPRLQTCECERSNETTLNQAFVMVGGGLVKDLLARPGNRLSQLLVEQKSAAEMLGELYWATLSRAPATVELQATAAYIEQAPDRRAALEDVAWGLLNSNEFLLRQ